MLPDRLAFKTGRHIQPVLATPTAIFKAIKRFYLQESTADASPGSYLFDHRRSRPVPFHHLRNPKRDGYLPLFAVTVDEAVRIAQQSAPRLIMVDTCLTVVSSQMILSDQLKRTENTEMSGLAARTANATADEEVSVAAGVFRRNCQASQLHLTARPHRTALHFSITGQRLPCPVQPFEAMQVNA
ncbi:MAG: hypothetical protein R2864_00135 [Syntrophotaleaceae bacterium]